MKAENYPFVMRPLPYEYDELCPVLGEETLFFHHDKHYKTYVDRLNEVLSDYPELQKKSLKELLVDADKLPAAARKEILQNAGGVYNHELYFDSMKGVCGQQPSVSMLEAIKRDFGSWQQWKENIKKAAASLFGSGWVWFVRDLEGHLFILQTANQDVPNLKEYVPLFLVDVWEHAYYLQYQNRRADYVQGWLEVINWRKAQKRYEEDLNFSPNI